MSNKRITKTFIRRIIAIFILQGVGALALGYGLAPGRPYLFVHLTMGSYVGEYQTRAECIAARRAFAAGRGIDTSGQITISGAYVDLCGRDIPSLNAGL